VNVDDGRVGWTDTDRQQFKAAIDHHLQRADEAIARTGGRRLGLGAALDQAMSRLDAAEAELVYMAPAEYVVGQLPSIRNSVARHLQATDPRRMEVERIAGEVDSLLHPVSSVGVQPVSPGQDAPVHAKTRAKAVIDENRSAIVGAMRGASSAALREQLRVRSFRTVVAVATVLMAIVATGLILVGIFSPSTLPLCFAPVELNEVTVVCPTAQSGPVKPIPPETSVSATQIDEKTSRIASSWDVTIVAIIGATGAAIAAAAALRRVRGSSEPYGVLVALAFLKIPTGAVTGVLGLTLMRGGFVPGLSALDTSAQILAWAAVFGYAQQLFTRLVDQQAHVVLDAVRGADKSTGPQQSS